jgi:predicted nucleotidyltransferase
MERVKLIAKLRAQRGLFDREQVRSVGLFGSRARDNQRPDSDVELLVEYESNARVSPVGGWAPGTPP